MNCLPLNGFFCICDIDILKAYFCPGGSFSIDTEIQAARSQKTRYQKRDNLSVITRITGNKSDEEALLFRILFCKRVEVLA